MVDGRQWQGPGVKEYWLREQEAGEAWTARTWHSSGAELSWLTGEAEDAQL